MVYIYISFIALLVAAIIYISFGGERRRAYESPFYGGFAAALVLMTTFRPLGTAIDDGGYLNLHFNTLCPADECHNWTDKGRDIVWYWLIAQLKAWRNDPSVMLWLAGAVLAIKLLVLHHLTRQRLLALLAFTAIFYQIHDLMSLRQSLAILIFMLGFWLSLRAFKLAGMPLLLAAGYAHKQAFLSPLALALAWLPPRWLDPRPWILAVLVLVVVGWYPQSGEQVATFISRLPGMAAFASSSHFEGWSVVQPATHPVLGRTIPFMAYPILILLGYLSFRSDEYDERLYQLCMSSIIIALLCLWFFASGQILQFRLFYFFLLPLVLLIGNVTESRMLMMIVIAVSLMHVIKYNVLHRVFVDLDHVEVAIEGQGRVAVTADGGIFQGGLGSGFLCGSSCYDFEKGDPIRLGAVGEKGYRSAGFSGDCESKVGSCLFSLKHDSKITAYFVRTFNLLINPPVGGVISNKERGLYCPSRCEAAIDEGTTLSLTASPRPGYRFAGWAGGGSCLGDENVCAWTMTADQILSAIFIKVANLKVSKSGPGRIWAVGTDLDCGQRCVIQRDDGVVIEVHAEPASGFRFDHWAGACQGSGPCQITLTGEQALHAFFLPDSQMP